MIASFNFPILLFINRFLGASIGKPSDGIHCGLLVKAMDEL